MVRWLVAGLLALASVVTWRWPGLAPSLLGRPFGWLVGLLGSAVAGLVPDGRWRQIVTQQDFLALKVLLAFVCLIVLRAMFGGGGGRSAARSRADHEQVHGSTTWIERFVMWVRPPRVGWPVGHLVAALYWHPHAILFGAPGAGKSSFLYSRIMAEPLGLPGLFLRLKRWVSLKLGLKPKPARPVVDAVLPNGKVVTQTNVPVRRRKRGRVVLTGNRSDPFRAAMLRLMERGEEAWIWAPGTRENEGDQPAVMLDVMEGPVENVAARIIAMHPVGANSTGLRAGAVEGVLVAALELIDSLGADRTFETLMPAMRHVAKELRKAGELSDQGMKGMDDWLERLRTLRRQFGDNIGPGVRISEVLARGGSFMVELSAYSDPTKTGPLAQYFIAFVMWLVASQGDFDVVLDEAGATDPTLYAKVFQATRAAGVRITAGGQSPAQFEDTIREMCSTVLLCGIAISAPEAADWASKVTKRDVEPADFTLLQPKGWGERLAFWSRKRGLRALQGYLLHNGRLDMVRCSPPDISIIRRYPWGSIASPTHTDSGRVWEVTEVDWEHMVPYTVVPLAAAGTGGCSSWSDGTEGRDYGDGTTAGAGWGSVALPSWDGAGLTAEQYETLRRYGVEQQEGWVASEARALPSASQPTMPGYFARHEVLREEWPKLSGTVDPNGDWLFPAQQVNGKANRAKIWVKKGTPGYGAKVERDGGYVLAYVVICRAANGEPPAPELDERGELRVWTVDHVCHTEDLTCPGGDKTERNPGGCVHRRCGNGAHHQWASPRQQYWRMKIHEERRAQLLAGERTYWSNTVCQAADEWIRLHPIDPNAPAAATAAAARRKRSNGKRAAAA